MTQEAKSKTAKKRKRESLVHHFRTNKEAKTVAAFEQGELEWKIKRKKSIEEKLLTGVSAKERAALFREVSYWDRRIEETNRFIRQLLGEKKPNDTRTNAREDMGGQIWRP